ncbi:MAG: hypothetical protein ACI90U_001572 [Pseudomonadales bacterium]|jgi:hypothetical protein
MEAVIKLSRVTQATEPKIIAIIICGLSYKSESLTKVNLSHRYIYAVVSNRRMLETGFIIIQ